MIDAYCGIDLAFAKRKRLPVVVCVLRNDVLEPLPLTNAVAKPPSGKGNKAALDAATLTTFAESVSTYIAAVESEYGVKIRRVAIDAPSSPKVVGTKRRKSEIALDQRGISLHNNPKLQRVCRAVRKGKNPHPARWPRIRNARCKPIMDARWIRDIRTPAVASAGVR